MNPKTKTRVREIKTPPAPDYTVINAMIEAHLELAWTQKNQDLIEQKAGANNFLKIQEIISFTSNQDVWLTDYSVSSAADKVSGRLSQHYPYLTPRAIFLIVNQAAYGWK